MQPKIAFVYDWFDTRVGGAERVLRALHDLYPDAPWYTSHVDIQAASWASGWDVRTSFLQYLPLWFRRNRILCLLLFPFAFESFDMSSYDVVVSVSSAFAKGVITQTHTRHICYLLTPARWLWKDEIRNSKFEILKKGEDFIKNILQGWDYVAAQRVDEFVSISHEVARRCKEYYGRESEVVYPLFDYEKWENSVMNGPARRDPRCCNPSMTETASGRMANRKTDISLPYFLVVSRLEPYKRVEVAIEAFSIFNFQFPNSNERKDRLIIVGSGSQKSKLKALSSKLKIDDTILWVDGVSDEELAWLYAHCKAFIMPQEEDFGYVACEAIACKAPIVAFGRGGQAEILAEYPRKVLCDEQSPSSFAQALEKIEDIRYNAQTYENSHICRGSRDAFVAAFSQKISQTV